MRWKDIKAKLADKKVQLATSAAGLVTFAVPMAAFAEGETTNTVTSAITNMATTVATDGQNMLVSVIPVLAPLVGAVILAMLGFKFVRRFSK